MSRPREPEPLRDGFEALDRQSVGGFVRYEKGVLRIRSELLGRCCSRCGVGSNQPYGVVTPTIRMRAALALAVLDRSVDFPTARVIGDVINGPPS